MFFLRAEDIDRAISLFINFHSRPDVYYISSFTIQTFMNRCYSESSKYTATKAFKKVIEYMKNPSASVIFFIIHGPFTEKEARDLLQIQKGDGTKKFNTNYHWSLLVHFKKSDSFYHYDSMKDLNSNRCIELLNLMEENKIIDPSSNMLIEIDYFPKQTSVWECGYFVIWAVIKIVGYSTPSPLEYETCLFRCEKDGNWKPKWTEKDCERMKELIFRPESIQKTDPIYINFMREI